LFGKSLLNFSRASIITKKADLLIVIGIFLQVYPAPSLLNYVKPKTPIILIAPEIIDVSENINLIRV